VDTRRTDAAIVVMLTDVTHDAKWAARQAPEKMGSR
jgi:hypothetical protein